MANNILKYSSKDYQSIKDDLTEAIAALSSTWTSREDGDPGIVLIKLMSALGDMLSYNLDKQALEYYGPTVTQRKNAAMLFELIGYKMHWYRAARSTITVTNKCTMPEYVTYYKRLVDGEDPVTVYMEYRDAYTYHDPGLNRDVVGVPPKIDENGNIPLPKSMEAAGKTKLLIDIEDEQSPEDPTDPNVRIHAINQFEPKAKEVYRYWQQDNAIGLHTYLKDPQRALGVYARDSGNIQYSLIPTEKAPPVNNGIYEPTEIILPYEPTRLPVIQGTLRSVTFTKNNIKENRYYVPDSQLDEDVMFLSYRTTDNDGNLAEKLVFIEKTDNLLTVTNFENADGTVKLYFEFKVDEFDYPYIELSSYWRDQISEDAVTFEFFYFRTNGKYGNITSDYLTNISSLGMSDIMVSNLPNNDYVLDSNGEYLCKPGYNPQTASDAYLDSINYVMTYNTIVTIYDFSRFVRRQEGISNSICYDGQYMNDLNDATRKVCNSYTREQLLNILGLSSSIKTDDELKDILYNIRKITFDYRDACYSKSDADTPPGEREFINYGLNVSPIWEEYKTVSPDTGKIFAYYKNNAGPGILSPYYLYGIYDEDTVPNDTEYSHEIQTMLDKAFRNVKICNVKPMYAPCRVFPWRCCGTIHLTNIVPESEAQNIVKNVITYLRAIYKPENMTFGKKVTYMELIDTIIQADPRIRYFDAGIGNTKLIDFEVASAEGTFYPTEAYFNPISIMNYVQTFDEVTDPTSRYYKMICVDPSYIQQTS